MKMNPVVHFEMPSKDKKRVAKLYESAFGWKMQQLEPETEDNRVGMLQPAPMG